MVANSHSNHEAIDSAIVKAIGEGKTQFSQLRYDDVIDALAQGHDANNAYRVIDRRLQSLRKRRLITFWKGKWRPANDR